MKKFIAIFLMIFSFTSIAKAQSLVRSGDGNYGKVLYNWDGTYLRSGESRYSTPLLNFDGQKIRMGESKYSTAKWFWDGTVLHSGENKYGELLFYKDGTRIRTNGKYGKAIFTIQGSIPLPVLIWICTLG